MRNSHGDRIGGGRKGVGVGVLKRSGPGGGGVLSLEKGTDCGQTAGERGVAVATRNGKKRGAVLILYCRKGGLSETVQLLVHIK